MEANIFFPEDELTLKLSNDADYIDIVISTNSPFTLNKIYNLGLSISLDPQGKNKQVFSVNFPLPVEVLPMARSYVSRQMVKLGGKPIYREGFVTDNGNQIIDVHNLKILDPVELEININQIPGVVTNGLFAQRKADVVLIAKSDGEVVKQ